MEVIEAYLLSVKGKYGHFRMREAYKSRLTYDFMHKPAFIGLLSAIVGIERDVLKTHYEQWCNDIHFCVVIKNKIQKRSFSFNNIDVIFDDNLNRSIKKAARNSFEVLIDPDYDIYFTLKENHPLQKAITNINLNTSVYDPILGVANCPVSELKIKKIKLQHECSDSKMIHVKGLIPDGKGVNFHNSSNKEQLFYMAYIPLIETVPNFSFFDQQYKSIQPVVYTEEDNFINIDKSKLEMNADNLFMYEDFNLFLL